MNKNILIQGDNLDAMHWLIANGYKGKIDLVYIDPPFATGGVFAVDADGRVATISKSADSEVAYEDTLKGKDFIDFLRERVALIYELLSDNGSLYLHIDYKIGHYVKVMLDEVFGTESFRNDITRIKCNPKNFARIGYGNIKDMILFYSKSASPIWNAPKEKCNESDIAKLYNIDSSVVSNINLGKTWRHNNEVYPLRNFSMIGITLSRDQYKNIIDDILYTQ